MEMPPIAVVVLSLFCAVSGAAQTQDIGPSIRAQSKDIGKRDPPLYVFAITMAGISMRNAASEVGAAIRSAGGECIEAVWAVNDKAGEAVNVLTATPIPTSFVSGLKQALCKDCPVVVSLLKAGSPSTISLRQEIDLEVGVRDEWTRSAALTGRPLPPLSKNCAAPDGWNKAERLAQLQAFFPELGLPPVASKGQEMALKLPDGSQFWDTDMRDFY